MLVGVVGQARRQHLLTRDALARLSEDQAAGGRKAGNGWGKRPSRPFACSRRTPVEVSDGRGGSAGFSDGRHDCLGRPRRWEQPITQDKGWALHYFRHGDAN